MIAMNQFLVEEFHDAFGLPVRLLGTSMTYTEILDLWQKLIDEEHREVTEAISALRVDILRGAPTHQSREHLLKELTDLCYVTYGAAVALGMDLDESFMRVHESNMSKLGEDGKPIFREDGKVLKGPNYHLPELGDLV